MKTCEYNGWKILNEMPTGWKIDRTAGSPLHGCEFITNGKSVFNGQQRALLRVKPRELPTKIENVPAVVMPDKSKPSGGGWTFDAATAKAVNELARKKFEERLLNDIMVDLMICEIEGWGKVEYINELKRLIGGLLSTPGGYVS